MKKLVIMIVFLFVSVLVVPVSTYAQELEDATEEEEIEEEPVWHEENPYIRHGGGYVQNLKIPNSAKAFQNSIDKGYTVIEMDFSFTADGKLVCIHDWDNGPMTYKQFKKSKLLGKYKRATADAVINMMIDNPDVYLVVDAKENDMVEVYREFMKRCEMIGDLDTMDRVIPQIYRESDLEQLKQIYDFRNYIFTLYRLNCTTSAQYKQVAAFCVENQVDVVTIPKTKVTKAIVKIFKKKNIKVYTHTVNTSAQKKKYLKMGVSGFYTDKF